MEQKNFGLPEGNPLKLISYLKRYKRQFWIQTVGGVLYNTIIVAGPVILGHALDAALALEKQGPLPELVRSLTWYCTAFLLITMFFQYARYVKRWYIRDMSNRIACDMRAGLLTSVLKYPMEKIDNESVGDLMSRTVGDVEQVVSTMQSAINETWDTWLLMVSYFAALLFYDPWITLTCSIPIPAAIIFAEWVRHPLYGLSTKSRRAASVVNSHLQKTLNGLGILRLYGREGVENERLKEFSTVQMKWTIRTSMLQTGMMPVYATLASVGVIGVIGLAGKQVVEGEWTVGYFTAYLTMFVAMTTRTWVAARVFNQFHAAKAAWDRIKEKIGTIVEGSGFSEAQPRGSVDTQGLSLENRIIENTAKEAACTYLEVDNLCFGYKGAGRNVLEDISFTVDKGSFVGITGPVGSGKSTLAALLTGLYSHDGAIRLCGREVSSFSGAEKVGAFSYSGQDMFLFSTSIMQNITFASRVLTEEEQLRLGKAVYISALSEDISLFPQGLDTQIGEKGIRLSGGQRQRIALARAIYAERPVLMLDDPFSAVDIATEKRMIDRMREGLDGVTIFVFSHRLAAFTQADKILVLEKGRLVEQGTHVKLMAENGIYEKIYSAQKWMEGEADEQ